MQRISLLAHQSEQDEPSRTGRGVLIGLNVVGCGVAQARTRLAR